MNSDQDLSAYTDLFARFLNRSMDASQFERSFLDLFKNDPTLRGDRTFGVLNRVFMDVDEFVVDDALRASAGGLDEAQLRQSVASALDELRVTAEAPIGVDGAHAPRANAAE